jgi:hypothetical protein
MKITYQLRKTSVNRIYVLYKPLNSRVRKLAFGSMQKAYSTWDFIQFKPIRPATDRRKGCGGGSEECLSKPGSPGMRKVYIDAYGVAGTGPLCTNREYQFRQDLISTIAFP